MALQLICGIGNASYMRRIPDEKDQHFQQSWEVAACNLRNPYGLAAPPFENPAANLPLLQAAGGAAELPRPIKIDMDHGTTTLGFIYQDGVVLAVDSRATGGQYVGSQTMKKIVEINEHMLGTLAGGAADCVYWDRVLTTECRLHELRNKQRISVAAASKIMANITHEYKGMGLSMGMMLAGYDYAGPQLYYIDSDGARSPGTLFSVGSGSLFAIGVVDSAIRHDLTKDEACELGRRAIYHATCDDAYSGGIVRVYHINKLGWENVSNTDCMDLHYMYAGSNADAQSLPSNQRGSSIKK